MLRSLATRSSRVASPAIASISRTAAIQRSAHTLSAQGQLHNKTDPAIPADATAFLPGDKITGETQIGNYPNLPMYNTQYRDATPSSGYWDHQDRRNFGETVPEEDEVLNIFSPDVWQFNASTGVKGLLAAALAFFGFGYLVNATQPEPHFERRTYENGLLDSLGVDASDEVMVEKRGARVGA